MSNTHSISYIDQQYFLRLPEVLKLIPVGKSTWWAGVKTGVYPKPYKIGSRITVWKYADIELLINQIEKGLIS